MKRFYCTICKRVKRVRQIPLNVSFWESAINPADRIGECDKHSSTPSSKPIKSVKQSSTPVTLAVAANGRKSRRG